MVLLARELTLPGPLWLKDSLLEARDVDQGKKTNKASVHGWRVNVKVNHAFLSPWSFVLPAYRMQRRPLTG
jgi:hypothetical protein